MSDKSDTATHHENFSVQCFNRAWDLMDKGDRSLDEDEEMLRLGMTSLWHWTQRSDCTDQHQCIGYWLISRIHAMLGRADEARRYGEFCLAKSGSADIAPFARAYAYEALARAESVAGNAEPRDKYIADSKAIIDTISDPDTQKMLLDDLATIP